MKYNTKNLKIHQDPRTGKYYTQAQLDQWATNLTGIKPDTGKNRDRKAGRNKGRYLKGKL